MALMLRGVLRSAIAERGHLQILPAAACRSIALRSHSSGTTLHPPPAPARVRQVDAACSLLAECVAAGDEQWFDSVAAQLRDALARRRDEIDSAASVQEPQTQAASAASIVGTPPVRSSEARGSTSASFAAPKPPGSSYETQTQAASSASIVGTPPFRSSEARGSTPASFAAPKPAASSYESVSAPAPKPAASSYERVSAPDVNRRPDPAAGRGTSSSWLRAPGEEQGTTWERALELLEAVASDAWNGAAVDTPATQSVRETQPQTNVDHSAEDGRMGRYSQLLGQDHVGATGATDARSQMRMQNYEKLLMSDKEASNAAPGASLPSVRFSDVSSQTNTRNTNSVRTPPPSAGSSFPPPPPSSTFPPAPRAAPARSGKKKGDDVMSEATGKGYMEQSMPTSGIDDGPRLPGDLRKEDLVWSEHQFNDGEAENKRVLKGFKRDFKKLCAEMPEGIKNPRLLTAALDLALAYVKAYELDKADSMYRRVIGECRIRGMPWDVKCIQDLATLRCKQNRQADCAVLLEELANKAPPHPATFINLGTVYNQLKQFQKAESWFMQAVNLKGGTPGREDLWNLGLVKKNLKKFDEGLPMLEQALKEFQEHEPDHPVTLAKLHSSVAGCLFEMGRAGTAIEQYQKAYDLYVFSVGKLSPLFCSAAEGLSKALKAERYFDEAFAALLEAFEVHASRDAVHPTPLFESLELALKIHDDFPEVELVQFERLIDMGIDNLTRRGMAGDGNAGLVMSRGGKLLSRAAAQTSEDKGAQLRARACELLDSGAGLIRMSHDAGEADLSHEILEAEMLQKTLRKR